MSLRVRETKVLAPDLCQVFRTDSMTTERTFKALCSSGVNPVLGTIEAELERSRIEDDVSQPSDRTVFKAVDHYVNRGAVMRPNDCRLTYDPPKPGCVFKLIGSSQLIKNIPEPTRKGADWGTLISEMADQLNGSINSGCLTLVTLAELSKTIQMVRNPFNLLRGDWRRIAGLQSGYQLAKAGANIFLESRYGWQSAAYDVKNFADVYKKIERLPEANSDEDSRLNFTTEEELSWENGGVFYDTSEALYNTRLNAWRTNPDYFSSNYADRKIKFKGYATYRLGARQNLFIADRMSRFKVIQNALGLDMASIPATLWEIIPYSFVVDWFINWQRILGWSKKARLYERDVYNLGMSSKDVVTYDIDQLYPIGYLNYYKSTVWKYRRPTQMRNPPTISGQGRYTLYNRTLGAPIMDETVLNLTNLGLSPVRLASGVSLLLQRAIN
jgi:hypothetical protein